MRLTKRLAGLIGLLAALAAGPASAETEVDLELVLAVDISRSMDYTEAVTQREGYIQAFRHEEVIEAIQAGLLGQIAVTYIEWSGPGLHAVIVPWMLIDGPEAAEKFGSILAASPVYRWQATSISDALLFAASLFRPSEFAGTRQVIDISGDGPNNMGPPVLVARQMVVDRGIVINGLPIMLDNAEDPFRGLTELGLDVYYEDCVIGGQGAFLVRVDRTANFGEAIRRKMVLEIAALPPLPTLPPNLVIPVQSEVTRIDCLIGERVRGYFGP